MYKIPSHKRPRHQVRPLVALVVACLYVSLVGTLFLAIGLLRDIGTGLVTAWHYNTDFGLAAMLIGRFFLLALLALGLTTAGLWLVGTLEQGYLAATRQENSPHFHLCSGMYAGGVLVMGGILANMAGVLEDYIGVLIGISPLTFVTLCLAIYRINSQHNKRQQLQHRLRAKDNTNRANSSDFLA